MNSAQEIFELWRSQPTLDPAVQKDLDAMQNDPAAIDDAFGASLQFGTGGLRGVLGAGTNRMNVHVVRRAAQAAADHLNETDLPKRAAIGYDNRKNSERFARETACVLAANGIEVYIYPRLEPVPALSFAVRSLSCGVGVCITASHNPAQYNGFKVYGADGCQLTPGSAARIASILEAHSYFENIRTCDFDALLAAGKIRWIPEAVLRDYLNAVLALRVSRNDLSELKLVYTPLNGSGRELAERLLGSLGVTELTLVKEQERPDGRFPTCPYPNPEIREAMALGLSYCDRLHPDLLIGTDPDCDRCGVAVPDEKGGYRLLTGNELGVLLLDFICRTRQAAGTMPSRPVAVTTIVSTDMACAVCQKYGVALRRTLTGFKFIGEQIGLLEREGRPERFVFGFEESYGYLSGTHVRDKDGINAILLVCEAAAFYKKRGLTLLRAMDELYQTFGYFACGQESFAFSGAHAMQDMQRVMACLRGTPPTAIAGLSVSDIKDYLRRDTGLPQSDVLEFRLENNTKLIVRPSGTEPKLKCYLSTRADSAEEASTRLAALAQSCRALLS